MSTINKAKYFATKFKVAIESGLAITGKEDTCPNTTPNGENTMTTFALNTTTIVKCTMKYARAYFSSFTSEKMVIEGAHKTETGNFFNDMMGNIMPNAFYCPGTDEYIFNGAMLRMPKKFIDIVALHEMGHKEHGHVGGKRLTSQELEADKYALERTTDKEAIELLIGFVVFNAIAPLVLGTLASAAFYGRVMIVLNVVSSLFLTKDANLEVLARVEQALTYLGE